MLFSAKETKREKRIEKKIEKNYYCASELFRNIGAIKFAEYLEDKNDLKPSTRYKLFLFFMIKN